MARDSLGPSPSSCKSRGRGSSGEGACRERSRTGRGPDLGEGRRGRPSGAGEGCRRDSPACRRRPHHLRGEQKFELHERLHCWLRFLRVRSRGGCTGRLFSLDRYAGGQIGRSGRTRRHRGVHPRRPAERSRRVLLRPTSARDQGAACPSFMCMPTRPWRSPTASKKRACRFASTC